MVLNRQIGDYVISSEEENTAPFFVWLEGGCIPMSSHQSVTAAVQQIMSYQQADKRRLSRVSRS